MAEVILTLRETGVLELATQLCGDGFAYLRPPRL
jgi:hypothetical protein